MAEGIWVENDDGSVQVNGDKIAFGLSHAGNVTLTDDGMTHPQPMVEASITVSGTTPILAFKPPVGAYVTVHRVQPSGGSFIFYLKCQSSVAINMPYWVFDTAASAIKDPKLNNVGLKVYDQFGVMTFDAAAANMRVVGYISPGMPPNSLPSGLAYSSFSSMGSFSVPGGKSYAIAQSMFGSVATMFDTGNYSNGTWPDEMETIPEDPDAGPGPGATWREMILESYWSMGGFSNSSTIEAGIGMFEHWKGWYPISQTEHLDINGSVGHLIIDVTDLLGGGGVAPGQVTVGINSSLREVSITGAGDSISPAVTLSISGGVSPYTILWQKLPGSNAFIENQDPLNSLSFRTKSLAQPANLTREAEWQARVSDSSGLVGYSPVVTFRHTTGAADQTPDPLDWANISEVGSSTTLATANSNLTVTGINAPIAIRATISDLVVTGGALTSSNLEIQVNNTGVGNSSGIGNGYWAQGTVTSGQAVRFVAYAGADSGTRTISYTVTVTNQTTGATLDTFTVSQSLSSNDYVPDPMTNFNVLNVSSNDADVTWNPGSRQITGINQPITLRFERYNYSGNLSALHIDVYTSTTSSSGPWTHHGYYNAHDAGFKYLDVTVTNNTWVTYNAHAITHNGIRSATVDFSLWNLSNPGGSVKLLDTNGNSFTVDADNNYNTNDVTPDPISLTNQSVVTNDWEGYTPGTYFQITGITQPITIRITRGATSDYENIFTRRLIIGYSNNGGASYSETNMGALSAPLDFTANNGDWFFLKGYFNTNSGRGSASWTTTVTNATTGTTLGSITVSGTVDNDNNYNVPDYVMNVPSLAYPDLITNDYNGFTNSPMFQVTGINQPVNLRWTRAGLSITGNIIYGRQYIEHSTNGGASWTLYLLTAAAGDEVNFTVNNGDYVKYYGYVETSGGRAVVSWYTQITNTTASQDLGYFYVNGTVDNDNNYNVGPALAATLTNGYASVNDFVMSGQYYTATAWGLSASASGGSPPYTYTWERTNWGGSLGSWSVGTGSAPGVNFYGYTSYNAWANYRCKVTDSVGNVAYTDDGYVEIIAGDIFA